MGTTNEQYSKHLGKRRIIFNDTPRIVEKQRFSARWQAVKKGLDAVNALDWGCAAYESVRKQSQGKEFAAYQTLSTASGVSFFQ